MTQLRALMGALNEDQLKAAGTSSLAGFFFAWLSLQRRPDRAAAARSGDGAEETLADEILSAQSSLMDIAARMPAQSFEDLAYKLALWRWDAASRVEEMDRAERMAHAAFCDLVELTGMDLLLPPEDEHCLRPIIERVA
jgi:hypothetical protein